MKILIVIGPALGTINHALALSNLLQENGHEVIWLTGPDARAHLKKMKSPYETYYSKNLNSLVDYILKDNNYKKLSIKNVLNKLKELVLVIYQ